MKPLVKTLLVFGFISAGALASAFGQAGPLITFDESGNALGMGPGVVMAADPSGGVPGPVLVYTLPAGFPPLTTGDLLLGEPGATNTQQQLSDVVRFWNPAGGPGGQIIFYSDVEAGEPPVLADTGLPVAILPNAFLVPEVGPEGANGAVYTPLPGAPGFIPGITYDIISDGVVPEPSTGLLAGLGGGSLLVLNSRRRTRR